MRILLINKFYRQFGGSERYLFSLQDMLDTAGHDTIPFAMAHPDNAKTPFSKYFVSRVDLEKPSWSWHGLRGAGRIVYSFEAARKLRKLIRAVKPKLAHLNNVYHQLSPSILKVLKEEGIPTVQTIHDYAYLSPSYGLFDHGAVCERVKPKKFFAVVGHRCVKNSYAASFLDAAAYSFHSRFGLDERLVGRLVAPSDFVKNKFAEWGRDVSRMTVLPHFFDASKYEPNYAPGDSVVFVGRLSEEKGLGVLLAAMEKIPEVKLSIIGSGPMEKRLKEFASLAKLHNVRFLGALPHERTLEEISRSRFVVMPSLFYETFGYAAIEAMAMGKAVIASRIGALPEIVSDGENGIFVNPNNPVALAEAMKRLAADEPAIWRMGKVGRQLVENCFRPDVYYARLMEIYASVM